MKSFLLLVASLLLIAAFTPSAAAFGCPFYVYCPPPPSCVSYQSQVITCYKPDWREEKVPVEIEKVTYRKVVTKVKATEYVPAMFDQKVQTCCYVAVPKVIEWDVPRCVMVPVVMVDPCTGCCYTACCPQWVSYKVQSTVCEYQIRVQESVVKVCKMMPQERTIEQECVVPEVTKEKSWITRRYCVMTPYQTTVCVPVYVPCCSCGW